MKTLHIFRHGKSSWKDPLLGDKERPLKKRGLKDAVLIAHASQSAGWEGKAVFSSTAVRASKTIVEIFEALGLDNTGITYCDELYTFDYRQLLDWLTQRREEELTIVGHDPALHDLIEWYTGKDVEKFPTSAYCRLEIDIDNWVSFSREKGQIKTLLTPKKLKNS